MHPTSRRTLALLAAGAAAIAGVVGGVNASAAPSTSSKNPNSDATVSTGLDSTSAVVGLSLAPLATDAKLAPAKGKKVDFNSSAAKSERAKVVAQRNTFKQWLKSNAPKAQVTGEYDVAVNAVAVRLNGTSLATLRNGPGVTSVGYQATYAPTVGTVTPVTDPDLSLIKATAQADPKAGARHQGRHRRQRRRRQPPVLRRCGLPGHAAAGQPGVHQQQGDHRQGLRQQGRQARLRRQGGRRARHPRRRHGRLRREHHGQHRRRDHPLRGQRCRPGRPARQLQRLPG